MGHPAKLETDAGTALSTKEQRRLTDLEQTIASAINGFAEAGAALGEIRDSKLYRATHKTFEDYCQSVWGLSIAHGKRLMAASSVQEVLAPIGAKAPSESIARELAPLKDKPAELIGAWQAAKDEHGKPTAAQVRAIVQERTKPPTPAPAKPAATSTVKVEVIQDAEIIDPPAPRVPAKRTPGKSPATLASFSRAFGAALADGWNLEEIGDVMDRVIRERSS